MAERVGFEPTAPFGVTGFQDQLLKPLGHLSAKKKKMVGVAGFEPAAHWSQTSCATKLRYTPILNYFILAGAEGLEPSTKVLETHVLPLHHAPSV